MTKLVWDQSGLRGFEIGVTKAVLYPVGSSPLVWNGLLSVKDNSVGGKSTSYFIDGQRFMTDISPEAFTAGVEAYIYPDALTQGPFGMTYVTQLGNDLDGTAHGYQIHLLYNVLASYSEKNYQSSGSKSETTTFGWDLATTPVKIDGMFPTAHLIIDSTKTRPGLLADFEAILYGTAGTAPRLPTPAETIFFFDDWCIVRITDNGDGTWTATGPDSIITMLDANNFQIAYETAIFVDADNYTISSY